MKKMMKEDVRFLAVAISSRYFNCRAQFLEEAIRLSMMMSGHRGTIFAVLKTSSCLGGFFGGTFDMDDWCDVRELPTGMCEHDTRTRCSAGSVIQSM